jgi:hypothetical protein
MRLHRPGAFCESTADGVTPKGAYCRFDPGAARQLAELLKAVAVYATGGLTAVAERTDTGAIKLLTQLR